MRDREKLLSGIEGFFGALKSVPWHLVDTEDLKKIDRTIENNCRNK